MQLDYTDPRQIALWAARIHALNTAASCVSSGSAPADHLFRESICDYLVELAADIAKAIEGAADDYDLSQAKGAA